MVAFLDLIVRFAFDWEETYGGSKSIEARIAELKNELSGVEGTPTEVYSRIVGYYRSVRNWNAGKREEYRERVAFSMPAGMGQREESGSLQAAESADRPAYVDLGGEASLRDNSRVQGGILVFTREACRTARPWPITSSPRA